MKPNQWLHLLEAIEGAHKRGEIVAVRVPSWDRALDHVAIMPAIGADLTNPDEWYRQRSSQQWIAALPVIDLHEAVMEFREGLGTVLRNHERMAVEVHPVGPRLVDQLDAIDRYLYRLESTLARVGQLDGVPEALAGGDR
jgi:hypothetical protein